NSLSPDVHFTPNGILDSGVLGVKSGDVVGPPLRERFQVTVDGFGDGFTLAFGGRHGRRRYPSAAAKSSVVVTGRSHTRPRQTSAAWHPHARARDHRQT